MAVGGKKNKPLRGKNGLGASRYCGSCDNRPWILLTKWMRENFYTPSQVKTLLRKRKLFAFYFKGRYYVKTNPDNPIQQWENFNG